MEPACAETRKAGVPSSESGHIGAPLGTARYLAHHPPDVASSPGLLLWCGPGSPCSRLWVSCREGPILNNSFCDPVQRYPDDAIHIAVFARAPVPGKAKTRLIPLLQADGAANAHRQMVCRTVQTVLSTPAACASLWSADEEGDGWLTELAGRAGMPLCTQRGATLGERMANCLESLLRSHRRVLIIGTDAPALTSSDFSEAGTALAGDTRVVFVPAEDGGYVLVGASDQLPSADLKEVFDRIDWGTPAVMSQTRARMQALGWQFGREWQELPSRWDVDEPDDFLRAVSENLLQWPEDSGRR